MNKFTLGAIAGASTLLLAIPFVAQISSAQSTSSSSSSASSRPVPSQTCVQAIVTLENGQLATMDAMQQTRKSALQAHSDALSATASITDDTQRAAALKKANDDLRTAMKNAMPSSDARQSAMDAVRAACGNAAGFGKNAGWGFGPMMGGKGGRGGMMFGGMRGQGPQGPKEDMLAQKLGITVDQLKTELQSGKTLQQIAEEHGVTLPAGKRGGWGTPPPQDNTENE